MPAGLPTSDPAPLACRLCGGQGRFVGRQLLMDRHDVAYFQCAACELIQTEEPHWLKEAYDQAIASLDTGAIERNRVTARLTLTVAHILGLGPAARCLDWGGGHGVFVRMMRDLGLDFHWSDRYAENLYARGFEGDPRARYDLVTSFEVLEHMSDVRGELSALFAARPRFVFVGTFLHQGYQPDWWYLVPETGQHVALFSLRTLQVVAEMFGYTVEAGPNYALFVAADAPLGAARRALVRAALRHHILTYAFGALVPDPLLGRVGRFRSRTQGDHQARLQARLGTKSGKP